MATQETSAATEKCDGYTSSESGELKTDEESEEERPVVFARPAPKKLEQIRVSFTCHLTKSFKRTPLHGRVLFDRIVTNIGDSYNYRDGRFTAPVGGIYGFYLTITDGRDNPVCLRMFRNGRKLAYTVDYEKAGCTEDVDTLTIGAVARLVSGDEVFVKNIKALPNYFRRFPLDSVTFSGFLIKRKRHR